MRFGASATCKPAGIKSSIPLEPAIRIVHGESTIHRWNLPCWSAFTYPFCRAPRGEKLLLCPACHSDSPRRSRRKGLMDYLVGITLLRPWRCRVCDHRFYAWAVPIAYARYAHCIMCGNMDLQRISREHGAGSFAWFFRMFHFSAYRCAPCRNRFFSMRPYRRIVPKQPNVESRTESPPIST
jgi:hypothetical protein